MMVSNNEINPRRARLTCALLASISLSSSCSDEGSMDFANEEALWMKDFGKVSLSPSGETQKIADGDCHSGTVGGLHVQLCRYKDALSADAARALGVEGIGTQTGAAVVRERTLLVVSDPDGVDVHGKTMNALTKTFLKPPKLPTMKAP